jgi:hypothetical protein
MSRYVGQCSVVRRRGPEEEANWHRMMELAEPVSIGVLLRHVDMSPLLDEDETVRQFIRGAGSDVAAFKSYWGDVRCWFLTIAGFDFIFVVER